MVTDTTGTVGATTMSVLDIVDDAHRLCLLPPQAITAEQIAFTQRQLFLMLSAWANQGINLFTIKKALLPQVQGQRLYDLPVGAVEVLNVNRRRVVRQGTTGGFASEGVAANAFDSDFSTVCQQATAGGHIGYDFGDGNPTSVLTVGVMSNGDMTYALAFEASDDLTTWREVTAVPAATYADRAFRYYDLEKPIEGRYFRVRETGSATLNVRQLVFGIQVNEIPLSREDRDTFVSQTNKAFESEPTMFWVDRQIDPRIWTWPASQSDFRVLVVWHSTQIEDVGGVNGQIAVPRRWMDALQYGIAHRVAMSLEGVDPGRRDELSQLANNSFMSASNEERDRSQVQIAAAIGAYSGSDIGPR